MSGKNYAGAVKGEARGRAQEGEIPVGEKTEGGSQGEGASPGTPEVERLGPMTPETLRRLDLELANIQPTQTSTPHQGREGNDQEQPGDDSLKDLSLGVDLTPQPAPSGSKDLDTPCKGRDKRKRADLSSDTSREESLKQARREDSDTESESEEGFQTVGKRGRPLRRSPTASPAFEEEMTSPLLTSTRSEWGYSTIYVLFQTFTGNFPTGGKLTDFIKSFNKHIGGPCQVIQPQQGVRGQMFRISRNQIGKAKTFEDAAIRTKTPIFSENINFPELISKKTAKSYATMFFDQATPIEGIKKLFNFKEQGITEMNRLKDKTGKITNEIKVTF